MADIAHELIDERIEKIERRLAAEYRTALLDLKRKLNNYLKDFKRKDVEMRDNWLSGVITLKDYKDWRQNQILTGQRYNALIRELSHDLTNVNEVANNMVRNSLANTFMDAANYTAYELETMAKATESVSVNFLLYNKDAVYNLIKEDANLLPPPSPIRQNEIRLKSDQWNMVKVNSAITQGILQGEAIGKIANRLQMVTDMNRAQALRNARTLHTQAESKGRQQRYVEAEEMGIDIGDLSTVILCSMPPAQSQFLQRAGRAGRKDGNALTLAVANARPHDLYYYADPMDMISGEVTPPKIFLRASAVLERQFVAFCMDSWVKKGVAENAIPEHIGTVLNKLDSRPEDMFPFNFLNYVQSTLSRQLNSFIQMFAGAWGTIEESSVIREELETFARGKGAENSPMHVKILDAFEDLKKQQEALRSSIDSVKEMIKELEAKPKDSSYDEEIKELKSEESALISVLQELGKKNIFNFLSDEGLLPNYAFPEAGIVLKAVLYRKEDEGRAFAPTRGTRKYEKMVYEYNRSASSAISEFAPNNSFYVDGRKLTIDQVDLTTAQAAKWRLCPSCSHAQIEETGKHTAACPRCGSPEWADSGQVRNMLKVQMVYSNMDYTKSLINDESEDRTNIFYCKQLLVDVDEDADITSAYRMDNEDFPFGYEFVRKATLREINFGERAKRCMSPA